jgi:hypothetical protein
MSYTPQPLPSLRPEDVERFLAKIHVGANDVCWPWTRGRFSGGYGAFWLGGRLVRAHRVAFRLWIADPGTDDVLHSCDNRPCANPGHLFLGDDATNAADKVAKGRQAKGLQTKPETRARGERQHLARLTTKDVEMVRASELSLGALALVLGVNPSTVARVRRGETWRHLLPLAPSRSA